MPSDYASVHLHIKVLGVRSYLDDSTELANGLDWIGSDWVVFGWVGLVWLGRVYKMVNNLEVLRPSKA